LECNWRGPAHMVYQRRGEFVGRTKNEKDAGLVLQGSHHN